MKTLLILVCAIGSLSLSARTINYRFECTTGTEVHQLRVTLKHAYFDDVTLTNMLPLDRHLPVRSYAFISDPWIDVSVDQDMLKGKNGYATMYKENLGTEQTWNSWYVCVRKHH